MAELLTPIFKDAEGREWDLTLNVGLIEDIRDKTAADFDSLLEKPEDLAGLLTQHPKKLVEILWVICESQCEQRSIDPRAFGRLFKREIIDNAVNTLIAALVLFYPRGSAGQALAEKLPAIIQKMDMSIRTAAEKNVQNIWSSIATDLPG